jgi:hypothetical protein
MKEQWLSPGQLPIKLRVPGIAMLEIRPEALQDRISISFIEPGCKTHERWVPIKPDPFENALVSIV